MSIHKKFMASFMGFFYVVFSVDDDQAFPISLLSQCVAATNLLSTSVDLLMLNT